MKSTTSLDLNHYPFPSSTEMFNEGFEAFKKKAKAIFGEETLKSFNQKIMISIAGTNGKGEVARTIDALIGQHDKRLKRALWTSPHLLHVRERMKFDEEFISDQKLYEHALSVRKKLEDLKTDLSYYEFYFCVFLCEALHQDVIIFECGMGGRLDAINLFDAKFFVLTSLGRDHMEYLGSSLLQLLREKCGLMREGQYCWHGLERDYFIQALRNEAHDKNVILKDSGFESYKVSNQLAQLSYSQRNQLLAHQVVAHVFDVSFNFDTLKVPLFGPFALRETQNPRLSFISAHNPQGLASLLTLFESRDDQDHFDVIVAGLSKRSDHDLQTMAKQLKAMASLMNAQLILTEMHHPKAISKDALQSLCERYKIERQLTPSFSQDQKVLVVGSNYLLETLLESFADFDTQSFYEHAFGLTNQKSK